MRELFEKIFPQMPAMPRIIPKIRLFFTFFCQKGDSQDSGIVIQILEASGTKDFIASFIGLKRLDDWLFALPADFY